MKQYQFPKSESKIIHSGFSNLTNTLLVRRGINSESETQLFLEPDYDKHLHDPFLLHDIEKARDRILKAMEAGEKIAIFSDYDCDGIPGAVILHDYFTAVGYKNFTNYIPHRHYEGFGLSKEAVDKLEKEAVKLIITIDCGTSDVEATLYAKAKGIDVIITDHHEPGSELPEATAVVNPKLGSYPFKELCGAATVFKLAQVLLQAGGHKVPEGAEKWWLDMVGIATIADMVPLTGENRVLATYGLKVLRKSRRPGLQQLLKKLRVDQRYLTEEDIGFTIGPRINAASRMDTPEDAFLLLATDDIDKAGGLALHLEKLNKERKTAVATITKELHKKLDRLEVLPAIMVLGSPNWKPSLVGLAANKLAEEYNRPVFLWGRDGNGVLKGSCRSGGGVSVVRLMETVSDQFIEYGGHHASGGFSVKDEMIHTLSESLNEAHLTLGDFKPEEETMEIDYLLSLDEVDAKLINELTKLAPYGKGNEKPLFAFKDVNSHSVLQFGKQSEHVKLKYQTKNGPLEAIAFFKKPEAFTKKPESKTTHTLLAHVEKSFFMGRQQIRLRIIDII